MISYFPVKQNVRSFGAEISELNSISFEKGFFPSQSVIEVNLLFDRLHYNIPRSTSNSPITAINK